MNETEAWRQRLAQLHSEIPNLFSIGKTVLYVGATPRRFQMGKELFEAGCEITLLEVFRPYADHYTGHPWLKEIICEDVRSIGKLNRKWDVVIWWHGPEHIKRSELDGVLSSLEAVASKLIVLGCPWGVNRQGMTSGNPYSVHQQSLSLDDFVGYKTRTLGKESDPNTWCHILAWKFMDSALAQAVKKKVIIYTAIFDGYDTLEPAPEHSICFTDQDIEAPGWEIRKVRRQFHDPRREARMYKVLSHQWFPAADISIWRDGNLMQRPLAGMASYLACNDLAVSKHSSRDCIYDEARAVIELNKAAAADVNSQVNEYRQKGYPPHNGLAATGVLVRKHTEAVERMNEMWWGELSRHTVRDQLSFDYVCWKLGIDYSALPIGWGDFKAHTPFNAIKGQGIT